MRTNSKQARENLKKYIINNFDATGYTDAPPEGWTGIAAFIMDTFKSEKYNLPEDRRYYRDNEQAAFVDWCAGLPSVLDTCYFYNRSAVDDLGAILEETAEEKARYTEERAELLLTKLIYRELKEGATQK